MSTDTSAATIQVGLNGKRERLRRDSTLHDVLQDKNLRPELVAVEYNGEILAREQYGAIVLKDDDQIEIVHFVGGG